MNRFVLRRIVDLDAKARELEDGQLHVEAVSVREEVCRLVGDHLGADHLWRISRLFDLAASCRRSGDLRRAEALYRDVIHRLEVRGEDAESGSAGSSSRHDLARGLNALGVLCCETDRHAEAVELFERALTIEDDLAASPARAAILSNLASAHHVLGHFNRAETRYREALAIHELAGERTSLEQVHCCCDLAELAADAERDDSENRAEQALALCRRSSERDGSALAEALIRLARLYRRLWRPDRATALFEEAVAILQETDGVHEHELALCLDQLSELRQVSRPTSVGSDR